MKEKKSIDRRIARTRLAVRDALVTMIKEKGFDALTVSDLVIRANINRGTFYLHFKDKFDLLEQTETEILHDLQSIFLSFNSLQIKESNGGDQLHSLVIILLEYVKEHADLMHAILGLQGDYSLITRIRSSIEQNVKFGGFSGLKEENFIVPKEYLISYIIQAHLGVLQTWLTAGCSESPQVMANILFKLSIDGPMRATGVKFNGL